MRAASAFVTAFSTMSSMSETPVRRSKRKEHSHSEQKKQQMKSKKTKRKIIKTSKKKNR